MRRWLRKLLVWLRLQKSSGGPMTIEFINDDWTHIRGELPSDITFKTATTEGPLHISTKPVELKVTFEIEGVDSPEELARRCRKMIDDFEGGEA